MDRISKEKRSKVMSQIKSKNTKPETSFRRSLWKKGYRYRIHYGKEKIDIAFPKKKIAIFIDGCFWHSCPQHSHIPSTNVEYWSKKLRRNVERAKLKDDKLTQQGWKVIHIWEHQIEEMDDLMKEFNQILR